MGMYLDSMLYCWLDGLEQIIALQDVIHLVTVFPELEQSLVTVVETIFSAQLDVQATQEEYLCTAANSAWCLGECLVALSKGGKDWNNGQYVDCWIRLGLERYPWSAEVVGGLAALAEFRFDDHSFPWYFPSEQSHSTQRIAFNDIFELLKAAILSHSHTLRQAALQFLASPAVERTSVQDSATRACLQAEEVPLTAQLTPERVLKTSRVGTACPVGEGTAATGVCVRWLMGMSSKHPS
jgi:hypothetical protein